jgi:RNA polymerase sigma-70 factor, ECF subfamily
MTSPLPLPDSGARRGITTPRARFGARSAQATCCPKIIATCDDTVAADDSIFARIAAGQPDALADFIDHYGGLVWSLVRSRVTNSADAADTSQEIFIDLWTSAARFDRNAGSEAVFISTIARRKLIDRFRAQARQPLTQELDEASRELAHDDLPEASATAEAAMAARALARLKPAERELLLMGVVEGMTHSEIARATGKPLGTVKAQLRRGLAKIRTLIEDNRDQALLASTTLPSSESSQR